MKLSIIIVNYNTKKFLVDCLASIYQSKLTFKYEIIVVDNASTDGSGKIIKKDFPKVRLISNHKNLGFAKANNKAVKIAKGKYLLFLNPDTVILDQAVKKMVEQIVKNPEISALGPKTLNPDFSVQLTAFVKFPDFSVWLVNNLGLDRIFSRVWPAKNWPGKYYFSFQELNQKRQVSHLQGNCFLVPKEIFEKIGLFDTRFFLYREETDWFLRLAKAKGKIWYLPSAKIIHYGGQSTESGAWSSQKYYQAILSRYLYHLKHYGQGSLWLLRIWDLISSLIIIPVWLMLEILLVFSQQARQKIELNIEWHRQLAVWNLKKLVVSR